MASALQTNAGAELGHVGQAEPLLVGQDDDALLNQLEVALNMLLIAAKN
jgi:hypothetical protein